MRNIQNELLEHNTRIESITDLALLGKEYSKVLADRKEAELQLAKDQALITQYQQQIDKNTQGIEESMSDKETYIKKNYRLEIDRIRKDASYSLRQDLADIQKVIEHTQNSLPDRLAQITPAYVRNELVSDNDVRELFKIKDESIELIKRLMPREYAESANVLKKVSRKDIRPLTELTNNMDYYRAMVEYLNDLGDKDYVLAKMPYTSFSLSKTYESADKSMVINLAALSSVPLIGLSLFSPLFSAVAITGAIGYAGVTAYLNHSRSKEIIGAFHKVKSLSANLSEIEASIEQDVSRRITELQEQIKREVEDSLADLNKQVAEINKQVIEAEDRAERNINSAELTKRLGASFEETISKLKHDIENARKDLADTTLKLESDKQEAMLLIAVTRILRARIEKYYAGQWDNPPKLINDNFFYNFDKETEEQNLLNFEGDALAWVYRETPYKDEYYVYKDSQEKYAEDLAANNRLALAYSKHLESKRLERAKTVTSQIAACVHPDCIELYLVDLQGCYDFTNLNTLNSGKTRYFPVARESSESTPEGNYLGYTDVISQLSLEMERRINSEMCIKFNSIKEYNKNKIQEGSTTATYKVLVMYNYKTEWLVDTRFEQLVRNAQRTGIIPIVFIDYNDIVGNITSAISSRIKDKKLREVRIDENYYKFLSFFEDKPKRIIQTDDKVLAGKTYKVKSSPLAKAFYKEQVVTDETGESMILNLNQYCQYYKQYYNYLKENKQ